MGSWVLLLLLVAVILGVVGLSLGRRKARTSAVVLGLIAISLALLGIVLFYLSQGGMDAISAGIPGILGIISVIMGSLKRKAPTTPAYIGSSVPGSAGSTNGLALASIIVVWFSSVVGLVLGHIALSQIRRTGETGHGMALTAVVVGWIATGLAVIGFVIFGIQYATLMSQIR